MTNNQSKRYYLIRGNKPLRGQIKVAGAKNAATKEIVASLLVSGKSILTNVPQIGDVEIVIDICRSLGVLCHWQDQTTLEIDTSKLNNYEVKEKYSGKNRIPILLMPPLLHKFGKAKIPILGGCEIGNRPVDFHIDGLQKLGAHIEFRDDSYQAQAKKLKGTVLELPYPSVGATENLIMAAVLAEGTTVIKNAAIEPEVVDLALFLQSMGAIIYLDNKRTWIVQGVNSLKPATHQIIPDRIEAASFAVSAVATEGDIYIEDAEQFHMMTFLNWLKKVGGNFEVDPNGIRFFGKRKNLKATTIETDVHPGFMTDWQQPFVVLLTQAKGISIVHETVYENRFGYTDALCKMGAKIQLFTECLGGKPCRFRHRDYLHSAVVSGPTKLKAASITIPDLRAGFSYLVAALAAEGESKIFNLDIIERGYSRIKEKFLRLGADITEKNLA